MTISTPTENDSIVLITVSDLKYANLIFVEHKKLTIDNTFLTKQVLTLKALNSELSKVDSLKTEQLDNYKKVNKEYYKEINLLNEKLKYKNNSIRYWQIGGIAVSIGLILAILIK